MYLAVGVLMAFNGGKVQYNKYTGFKILALVFPLRSGLDFMGALGVIITMGHGSCLVDRPFLNYLSAEIMELGVDFHSSVAL